MNALRLYRGAMLLKIINRRDHGYLDPRRYQSDYGASLSEGETVAYRVARRALRAGVALSQSDALALAVQLSAMRASCDELRRRETSILRKFGRRRPIFLTPRVHGESLLDHAMKRRGTPL